MRRAPVVLALGFALAGCGAKSEPAGKPSPPLTPAARALQPGVVEFDLAWMREDGLHTDVALRRANGRVVPIYKSRTSPGHGRGPLYFAWSPDGSRIVTRVATATQTWLQITQLESRMTRPITKPAVASFYEIAWSPDGKMLAEVTSLDKPRCFCLVLLDLKTKRRRRSAPGMSIDSAFSWSPDGTRIVGAKVVRGARPFSELRIVDVADGEATPVAKLVGRDPTWSPDGKQVAYADTRGIAVASAAGKHLFRATTRARHADRDLPYFPAHDVDIGPHWSPDGRWLAYVHVTCAAKTKCLQAVHMIEAKPNARPIDLGIRGTRPRWRPIP